MKNILTVIIFLFAGILNIEAQSKYLSLGSRSTLSFFDEGQFGNTGLGVGGQFRVKLFEKVNTEWYADFIKTDHNQKVYNNTAHIGWSVLYYPTKENILQPYMIAGHCFDYAKYYTQSEILETEDRWSMAVQAGIGTHFNLSNNFDFSLSGQYMTHFGKHINIEENEGHVHFSKQKGEFNLQGHILVTASINYKLYKF